MSGDHAERNAKIRQLATDFYRKERAAVLKNSAAKKMKDVFNNNPDVFRQKNGWMDSFAMDRFGDEVYAATIVDAMEQKYKKDPSYKMDVDGIFSKLDSQGKDLRTIFVERLSVSSIPAAAEAGKTIEEEWKQGEIEKAEAEAREKRIQHMENQKEILARIEALVKANNTDGKHPIKVADLAAEVKDKFLDREMGLWQELYKMYNPKADDAFCIKMMDGLFTRFAKNYYNGDDAADSFAKVPEEERRSWISRLHENSLYLFGQLAQHGNDRSRKELSDKRFAPNLSAEMYRRYPEYEADTLAEMPVLIRFIRGSESELESSSVGYRYKMKDGQVFIIPSDIVKSAEDFNGFIIRGTRGWVRRYVLYASNGSDTTVISDVEADAAAANERFYKQILSLFSK